MRFTKCPTLTSNRSLFFILASAALASAALAQQPIPPAEHLVEVGGSFGLHDGHVGSVPLNLAVDWVGQWGDFDYSMQATAHTTGGLRPQATVQAEASAGDFIQYNVRAMAKLDYYVRLRPRGTPPPGTYSVPVLVDVRGEVQGTATAYVRINYGPLYQVETLNGVQSFEGTASVDFYPSDPEANLAIVQLYAYATGYHLHPTYAASSQAYADPLFRFDQATFDLYQGQDTFPLADYFEFEYSEDLLNPPCLADFNSDTAVDFFDYLDFVDAFSAQLPAADFNQDSSIDFFDYLDFVDAFSTGC